MAKSVTLLEYTFIFKAGENTWTRGIEFETDLSKFFATVGLEAEVVETFGGSGRRVIFISSMNKLDKMAKAKTVEKGPQKKLKEMAKKGLKP